ncbi:hypothetical protein [Acetobacterium bakii]|uniref:DUF4190 domain-containing protein n=1 Tax=Acetobacterium bakii TaxID=52689 RepID=A0A0L6U5X6_9FIRM|nr:hypothetical protein [Acetobacterium bakii]KNZ43205.1 hypothetical protein AKG39_01765 [Acetobacterium bakii]
MEQYSSKATASLVLGIISLVSIFTGYFVLIGIACAIVGLIFGIQIRKAAQLEGFNPSNIATAGFILSLIGVILCTIVFISCVACVGLLGTLAVL